ncbi:MAG: OB-fold nucleic acid binding domain-containing protein [Desulfurococcaceae archaeon]
MYPSTSTRKESPSHVNIMDLKPGMENVAVKVRVISVDKPKVIQTKKGPRTISNAMIGDETGRVEATLWGEKAGSIDKGQVIEIKGAWVTEFKGKVQLNVGKSSTISQLPQDAVSENIPDQMPRGGGAETRQYRGRKPPRRGTRERRGSEEGEEYE